MIFNKQTLYIRPGRQAARYLESGFRGEVLSARQSYMYCSGRGALLLLHPAELGTVPFGVGIAQIQSSPSLGHALKAPLK